MRTSGPNLFRTAWLVLVACLMLIGASWGSAADRSFTRRYPAVGQPALNATGNIAIIGNTLETCLVAATPNSPASCPSSVLSTAPGVTNTNNNQFNAVYVNQGGSAGNGVFNASQSTLNIPTTATVKWAGLYWGGDVSATTTARNTARLATPVAGYKTVTGTIDSLTGTPSRYQGFVDVTAEVKAGGNGTYTVADVYSTTGVTDKYAGWSLVVVYTDVSELPRNLSVFDGFLPISNGAPQTITISPFVAPPSGAINARVGVVAYEGDRGTTGDALNMSSSSDGTTYTAATALFDAARPANNFFDSGITSGGSNTSIVRTPSYANQLGFDIAMLDVYNPGLNSGNSVVKLGATSARLNLTSSGDTYYPGVVTTAIEIYSPSVTNNLTKTVVDVNGGGLEPGDILEYTIGASNTGQDGASAFVLTDVMPPGTTYVPGSLLIATGANAGAKTDATGDDQGEYAAASRKITVRLGTGATSAGGGTLNPAASTSVKFRVTVDTATTRGTVIDNTADVSFNAQTLGTSYNGTTPTASIAVGRPDLTLSKSHSGSFTLGQPGSFSFTVTNLGPGRADGPTTVTDVLPAGLTLPDGAVAISGANAASWTCTSASNTVTCTSAAGLALGASSTFTVGGVAVGAAAVPSVTNTASVSTAAETATGNNGASDPVTVLAPDLTLTKTHTGTFAQTQSGATYTLTARNSGTSVTTSAVTVTDTLPAGLTASALSGAGWTCVLGTLTCTRSDGLAAGASYPAITLTVTVSATAPTSVTNTASVSGGGEVDTANNAASDPTTVTVTPPDLTLSKTHTGSFVVGQPGSFSFTVNNVAAGTAVGTLTVTDTLPGGLSLPDGAVTLGGPNAANWSCTSASNTVTCASTVNLPGGASSTFTVGGIAVGAAAVPSVTNTASVSNPGETATGNNSASDVVSVLFSDMTITKSHLGTFSQEQAGASYTLTATNIGTAATSGTVTVTDTLPAGLTATSIGGPGWTCVLGTLTCTRSDGLAAGASYPAITLTVSVAANAPASVTNQASVSGGGQTNTANDTASDLTTITAAAPDLILTKTHTGSFVQGQSGATYTLTATNSGSLATSGTVTVIDTLPAGLTATALSGAGWTCVLGTLSCTRSDGLAAGASYPAITLTVNIAANAPASVTNTATVSGGGQTNTANDSASDVTPLGSADLTLTKSHLGSFSQGQVGAAYTLTASNSGTAPTSGTVTVTDTLPAGLTASALSGAGWTCVLGTLSCTRSDGLAAGASYPAITLTVSVSATAPPSVTNTASVSGGGEVDTANNAASDPTTVDPRFSISGAVYSDSGANGQRDFGEAGVSGVALTLRDAGGAILATTTSSASGAYSFPLLPAGTYSVTETQPSGFVSTSPDSVRLTVSSASLSDVNFGEFAGVKVTGQVFRDDGWGAGAAQANDALQNGTEAGVSAFTVVASSVGGVVASAVTTGGGLYSLYLPTSAGSVTVLATPTPAYTATGVNDGSAALHRASSVSDPLASQRTLNVAAAAGQTLSLNFGLVPQLKLTPDSAQAVSSPGSALYQQRLSPGTAGTLTLSVTPSAGSVYTYQLWHDLNQNGRIDPGTDTLLGLAGSLTLTSSAARTPDGTVADLQLLLSVSAPSGVASGLTDPARLSVTQQVGNLSGVTRAASVTDTTSTGAGGLKLTKFVRNASAGSGFSPTTAEGQTGDTLEYCINYQNLGSSLLETALLTDPVPFFTATLDDYGAGAGVRHVPATLVVAGGTSTPGSAGHNLTSAADADAGTLTPRLLTVAIGDVAGGGRGTVCYRVSVQ